MEWSILVCYLWSSTDKFWLIGMCQAGNGSDDDDSNDEDHDDEGGGRRKPRQPPANKHDEQVI